MKATSGSGKDMYSTSWSLRWSCFPLFLNVLVSPSLDTQAFVKKNANTTSHSTWINGESCLDQKFQAQTNSQACFPCKYIKPFACPSSSFRKCANWQTSCFFERSKTHTCKLNLWSLNISRPSDYNNSYFKPQLISASSVKAATPSLNVSLGVLRASFIPAEKANVFFRDANWQVKLLNSCHPIEFWWTAALKNTFKKMGKICEIFGQRSFTTIAFTISVGQWGHGLVCILHGYRVEHRKFQPRVCTANVFTNIASTAYKIIMSWRNDLMW